MNVQADKGTRSVKAGVPTETPWEREEKIHLSAEHIVKLSEAILTNNIWGGERSLYFIEI